MRGRPQLERPLQRTTLHPRSPLQGGVARAAPKQQQARALGLLQEGSLVPSTLPAPVHWLKLIPLESEGDESQLEPPWQAAFGPATARVACAAGAGGWEVG